MRRLFPASLPIHLRIMALAVTAMAITILAMAYLVWRGPPPRPAPASISQIAEMLTGERYNIPGGRDVEILTMDAAPEATQPLSRAPLFERIIAKRLDIDESRVLAYVDEEGGPPKFSGWKPDGPPGDTHPEPPFQDHPDPKDSPSDRPEPPNMDKGPPKDFFDGGGFSPDSLPPMMDGPPRFNRLAFIKGDYLVAIDLQDGQWRTVRTLKEPLLSEWILITALVLGLVLLLVIGVSWALSGQITWPLRKLAWQVRQSPGHRPDAYDETGAPEIRAIARALNDAARDRQDMMTERTDMLAAIAHDLQTPLARLAYRIDALPESSRAKANEDLTDMRLMIASVLDFLRSGTQASALQKLDLSALLETVVEGYQDTGSDVSLSESGRSIIQGDPLTLRRLFSNIIDNAVRYAGGAEISLSKSGAAYLVSIRDDGPGVSPEFLPRIFLPFSRENEARTKATGTMGLGMSVARDIALQHGGEIEVRNRDGGGLEVLVRLPAA